jgi:hypothetical protein
VAQEPEPVTVTVQVGIDGSVSVDGEQVKAPVATKTQVTREIRVSGSLSIYGQHTPAFAAGSYGDAPTAVAQFSLGSVMFVSITDISQAYYMNPSSYPGCSPAFGMGEGYIFRVGIGGYGPLPPQDGGYYYFDGGDTGPPSPPRKPTATPWEIELDYSLWISAQRLHRTLDHSPSNGRENSPVYSREVTVEDEWVSDPPGSYAGTLGEWSIEGAGYEGDPIPTVNAIDFLMRQTKGTSGVDYVVWTVKFDDVEGETFEGLAWTGTNIQAVGSGNALTFSCTSTGTFTEEKTVAVGIPYIKDFSDFAVVDRDGNLLPDLLIAGGFVADPRYPWTADCPTT